MSIISWRSNVLQIYNWLNMVSTPPVFALPANTETPKVSHLTYLSSLRSLIRPSTNGHTIASSPPNRFNSSSLVFLINTAPVLVTSGFGIIADPRDRSLSPFYLISFFHPPHPARSSTTTEKKGDSRNHPHQTCVRSSPQTAHP
jgi:hypothetical protein